ncbi:MAG: Peptidase M23 family protein [Candidatus Woesebacteria bacterium GW2011_GWA1_37_8]|uniref:Peptidase M23 family protein n=1 Tax=Candidatus Woesebacteria bacterium GW2011_GWA1_37_8 TaxID=1618546 RepID=A0A0G0HRK9_9BACT|nr:MAG: Peptidase M23 family protein [Candidatus Woesebacteria bacterium GW2011_GWA1_37_8]
MIRLSIHLPVRYRLDLHLVKRREGSMSEPTFPTFKIIKGFKSGNKLSRYFRHIFEKVNIKKFFGANIALMLISSSVFTTNIAAVESIPDNITTQSPVVFKTEQREIKYPTNTVKITQKFSFFHPGVDLDGITGDSITPIMDGVVTKTERSRVGYGNSITINHGGEVLSLYAHLSKINVIIGQEVNTNTVIGLMGATGRAFGDHLNLV